MQSEFRIGDFVISPRTSTISRREMRVRVEPKTMDLLIYLAQTAGELVEKRQILSEVWGGYHVTEQVLSNIVWKLRGIFKDNPQKPRYIETIYKKGYRLVAPVHFPEHGQPAKKQLPLTVGHQSERTELQSCYRDMLSGRGLVVTVTGEAGIGKTTFAENFLRLHANECFIGRGNCSEHLSGTAAYLPFFELLGGLTGSSPESQTARLLRRTAPCWYVQVFPHAEDSSSLFVQTAGSSVERMKRELVEFFSHLSNLRPVLLFFDDVHWADASSIDIGAYLVDRCSSMRILILAAYRPELLLSSNSPLIDVLLRMQVHGTARRIQLQLLQRKDVSSYIDQSFPHHRFPTGFAESIYRRTEGNPLFMVDLLSHLKRRRFIIYDGKDSSWVLRHSIAQIENIVPDSVQGLIELKMRQMGEHSRRLLTCATVQGPEFESAIIARALGADQAEMEQEFQKLDRIHGFLRQIPTSARQIRSERYQFAHILYWRALHNELCAGDKALLSAGIAQALIDAHGEKPGNLAADIAFLMETAGDFSIAAKYFATAADHAREISAYPEALALARRGLGLLDRIPEGPERSAVQISLNILQALSLSNLKGYGYPEVRELYDRIYKLCIEAGNNIQASRYLLAMASYWEACANLKKTLEVTQRYYRLPKSHRNAILETWFYLISSIAVCHSGEPVRALEFGRQCVEIGDSQDPFKTLSFGDLDAGVVGRIQLAKTLWLCGYPDQARSNAEQGLATARKIGHPATLSFAFVLASWLYQYLNDTRYCLECAEEAIQVSVNHGFLMQEGWGRAFRGWAMACSGKEREGIPEMERGLQIHDEIGWRLGRTELMGLNALALLNTGNTEMAAAVLDQSLSLMQETSEIYYEPELYHVRAQILLRDPSPSNSMQTESLLIQAIDAARRQCAKSFELRASTTLARHYMDQGRADDGFKLLSAIYDWFTEGFDTPDLQMAARLLKKPRRSPARRARPRIRSIELHD